MSSAPPLNYAPRQPPQQRWSRWLFFASVLLAIAASSLWWLPTEYRRLQMVYWQRRCLAYTASADHVVFDPNSTTPVQSPVPWTRFYSIYSPPWFRTAGTLFLHELKTPNGEPRLVALDLDCRNAMVPVVYPRVFIPGNFFRSPAETSSASRSFEIGVPAATLFAGTPDPADPCHFTFHAKLHSLVVTYDGWLGNDNRVTIGQGKIVPSVK
jgi:hypothetical protein